jgi:hypothetical protein
MGKCLIGFWHGFAGVFGVVAVSIFRWAGYERIHQSLAGTFFAGAVSESWAAATRRRTRVLKRWICVSLRLLAERREAHHRHRFHRLTLPESVAIFRARISAPFAADPLTGNRPARCTLTAEKILPDGAGAAGG